MIEKTFVEEGTVKAATWNYDEIPPHFPRIEAATAQRAATSVIGH